MTAQILHGSKTTLGSQNNKDTEKQLSKNSAKICCMANTLKHESCCTTYVIKHFQDRNKARQLILCSWNSISFLLCSHQCTVELESLSWVSGKNEPLENALQFNGLWIPKSDKSCRQWCVGDCLGRRLWTHKVIVPVSLVRQAEVLMWLQQRAFAILSNKT